MWNHPLLVITIYSLIRHTHTFVVLQAGPGVLFTALEVGVGSSGRSGDGVEGEALGFGGELDVKCQLYAYGGVSCVWRHTWTLEPT